MNEKKSNKILGTTLSLQKSYIMNNWVWCSVHTVDNEESHAITAATLDYYLPTIIDHVSKGRQLKKLPSIRQTLFCFPQIDFFFFFASVVFCDIWKRRNCFSITGPGVCESQRWKTVEFGRMARSHGSCQRYRSRFDGVWSYTANIRVRFIFSNGGNVITCPCNL